MLDDRLQSATLTPADCRRLEEELRKRAAERRQVPPAGWSIWVDGRWAAQWEPAGSIQLDVGPDARLVEVRAADGDGGGLMASCLLEPSDGELLRQPCESFVRLDEATDIVFTISSTQIEVSMRGSR